MMVVELDSCWRVLGKPKFGAGFLPKLPAVAADLRSNDTVHDDDAVRSKVSEHLGHDFLEMTTMTANENGIGRIEN